MKKGKAFHVGTSWKVGLLTVLAAVGIFAGFTVHDRLILQKTILNTFEFMQNRLTAYESYAANDEVKSLIHLLDKTTELSRVVGALGTPDQTVLDSFVSEQRLSSVMVLDENMQLQAHAGSDTPEHWENLFQSGVIQDIAEHPQKVYFSRVTDGDSVYDVAAVARRDALGVVFTSHEQEKDVEGEGDFSLDELFSGFTFDMDGVVAVSDGSTIINSNLESLQGLSLEESRELYSGSETFKPDTITCLRSGQGTWYGSKTRVRSYDLYVFFPGAQVFRTRTIVMVCSLTIMLVSWLLVLNLQGRTERETLEQSQKQLEKTAEDARRANAAKTDFLRRMSHDIRTPINGIQGMVEISRHYVDDEVK